jgi:hypothetical protein
MIRMLAILLALAPLALWAQPQPQKQKQWKDQAEYALYDSAQKAADPHQKLAALDQWKAKYPETDYQRERLALYLQAYQQLNDVHAVVKVLNEMRALNPKDLDVMKAILVFILAPQYHDTGEATLDNGARVAQAALDVMGDPPSNTVTAALAHTMLGWVAMNRKDNPAAEKSFRDALRSDANAAQVDFWLANVLRAQKTPEKISQALFFYARAATYEGPGSLGPSSEKEIEGYLRKAYTAYHGPDDAGLADLETLAKAQSLPPDGFHIKSIDEVAADKEEALKQSNPQLALWLNLKKVLAADGGAQYFDTNMKGTLVPGGAEGIQDFRGTVLSATPPFHPKQLVVAISDPATPEATLKLDTPLTAAPEIGSPIQFEGIAESFTPQPYMLTFAVEREKIKDLKLKPSEPSARRRIASGKR